MLLDDAILCDMLLDDVIQNMQFSLFYLVLYLFSDHYKLCINNKYMECICYAAYLTYIPFNKLQGLKYLYIEAGLMVKTSTSANPRIFVQDK